MKFPSVVFSLGLSAHEIALFAYLYLSKNREYKVCVTYSDLSRKLKVSSGLLVRSIRNLEKKGLLSVVKRYFRYRDTFSHRNCYHLIAPMSEDPDLPLRKVLFLPLSLQEKGLLLFLIYIAGEEGDTYMTGSEVLSRFKPKPYRALKSLRNMQYIYLSSTGIKVVAEL